MNLHESFLVLGTLTQKHLDAIKAVLEYETELVSALAPVKVVQLVKDKTPADVAFSQVALEAGMEEGLGLACSALTDAQWRENRINQFTKETE
jgi:hypothetical protein